MLRGWDKATRKRLKYDEIFARELRERNEASARKKRNGAMRDVVKNTMKADKKARKKTS